MHSTRHTETLCFLHSFAIFSPFSTLSTLSAYSKRIQSISAFT